VAICSATATGEAQVHYKGAGLAEVRASAFGEGIRDASGRAITAQATAQAIAQPVALYSAAGVAQVSALAQGVAQASFFGAGVAQADAYAAGSLQRRVRMPFQPPARAVASAQGEVVSYVLAYGRPAHARARLVGTTYHVGRGIAQATAALFGDAQKQIGERQFAHAQASGFGTQVYIAGAAGRGIASAEGSADAAVTKGGVRYFELFGTARATAQASLSHVVIYQPQVMRAFAHAYGSAVQIRGFAGKGVATAKATGYMDMTYTGQEGEPASVTAMASGYCVRHVFAAGVAKCTAQGFGSAMAEFRGAGSAALSAEAQAQTMHLMLANQPAAEALATATGRAQRIIIAGGVTAQAVAEASGYNQINDLSRAPSSRTAMVTYAGRVSAIGAEPRTIRI
jgi:hypothetical protein